MLARMEGTLIIATFALRHRPRRVAGYMLASEPLLTLRPVGELAVTITES